MVPRAGILIREPSGGLALLPRLPDPRSVLRPGLAYWLAAGGDISDLSDYERVQGRHLVAAALCDIRGLTFGDVVETLRPQTITDPEHAARRDRDAGRKLWATLGGWPWCDFTDGKLPWRRTTPRESFTLQVWATGRIGG